MCIRDSIVLPVAIVGILWKTNHVVWPWLLSLIFLGSTAIAVTHVGVELSWWRWGGCSSTLDTSSIEALQLALLNAPVVRCDEVPWSLFGISMAGYNVLLSAGFTLYYGYEGVHRCCRQSHV
jgi:disulfide bond formation protein DsbB